MAYEGWRVAGGRMVPGVASRANRLAQSGALELSGARWAAAVAGRCKMRVDLSLPPRALCWRKHTAAEDAR